MPSVYRQKNNIVPAIRGCAKSAAPDVLYAARIDVCSPNTLKIKFVSNRSKTIYKMLCDPQRYFTVGGHTFCIQDNSLLSLI